MTGVLCSGAVGGVEASSEQFTRAIRIIIMIKTAREVNLWQDLTQKIVSLEEEEQISKVWS